MENRKLYLLTESYKAGNYINIPIYGVFTEEFYKFLVMHLKFNPFVCEQEMDVGYVDFDSEIIFGLLKSAREISLDGLTNFLTINRNFLRGTHDISNILISVYDNEAQYHFQETTIPDVYKLDYIEDLGSVDCQEDLITIKHVEDPIDDTEKIARDKFFDILNNYTKFMVKYKKQEKYLKKILGEAYV